MTFDRITVPATGERVRYNRKTDSFADTDVPIVPYAYGSDVGKSVVSAAHRVLDAAAEEMGRSISWMRVYAGDEAISTYGTPLPGETVRALERFRFGILGPLPSATGRDVMAALRQELSLTEEIQPISHLAWTPSTVSTRSDLDIVCFRGLTEDVEAGLEFEDGTPGASRIRALLDSGGEFDVRADDLAAFDVHDGDFAAFDVRDDDFAAFGIRPITRSATERLTERAVEYALDRDRTRLTVVHQGDQLPATEGGFRRWAMEYLDAEYGDAIVSEDGFDATDRAYPEDEILVGERQTDDLCRDLLTRPGEYDVLVAPAGAGMYVSTIGSEIVGGRGVTPTLHRGGGTVVASSCVSRRQTGEEEEANPIAAIRAGCLLFDLLGWDDVVGVVEDAIEATLHAGFSTRDLSRRVARCEVVSTATFAERVVDHIHAPRERDPSGGVRTTAEERAAIRGKIAGLYNTLFAEGIQPEDLNLNQLRGKDEEADIYLPEVGINFRYWRRWSVERRLEVLLHELAHIENYDDGHAPTFYDRFVELTDLAEDWQAELEVLFDSTIDFKQVKRLIVESVHEDTIESDIESVQDRKRALQRGFGVRADEHY